MIRSVRPDRLMALAKEMKLDAFSTEADPFARRPAETAEQWQERIHALEKVLLMALAERIRPFAEGALSAWAKVFPQVNDSWQFVQEESGSLAWAAAQVILGVRRWPRSGVLRMAGRAVVSVQTRLEFARTHFTLNAWREGEDLETFLGRTLLDLKMDAFKRKPGEPVAETSLRLAGFVRASAWQHRSRSRGLLAVLTSTVSGRLRLVPLALCRCGQTLSPRNGCGCAEGTGPQVLRPAYRFVVDGTQGTAVDLYRCSNRKCSRLWHLLPLSDCPACSSPLLSAPIQVYRPHSPVNQPLPEQVVDEPARTEAAAATSLSRRFANLVRLSIAIDGRLASTARRQLGKLSPADSRNLRKAVGDLRAWIKAELQALVALDSLRHIDGGTEDGLLDKTRIRAIVHREKRRAGQAALTLKSRILSGMVPGKLAMWNQLLATFLTIDGPSTSLPAAKRSGTR